MFNHLETLLSNKENEQHISLNNILFTSNESLKFNVVNDTITQDMIIIIECILFHYQQIFYDYGTKSDIKFLDEDKQYEIKQRIQRNLCESKDSYIKKLCQYVWDFSNENTLKLMDMLVYRFNIFSVFPSTIYHIVRAVYDTKNIYKETINPNNEYYCPLPILNEYDKKYVYEIYVNKTRTQAGFELPPHFLKTITNKNIDSSLPKFWRLMHVLFNGYFMQDKSLYKDIDTILYHVVDILGLTAQPLHPKNISKDTYVHMYFNNYVSAFFIRKILIGDNSNNVFYNKIAISNILSCFKYDIQDYDYAIDFFKCLGILDDYGCLKNEILYCKNKNIAEYADLLKNLFSKSIPSISTEAIKELDDTDIEDKLNEVDELDTEEDKTVTEESDVEDIIEESSDVEETINNDPENTQDNIMASDTEEDTLNLLTLASDNHSNNLKDFLFRYSVLKVVESLSIKNVDIVEHDKLSVLKHWCTHWLWLVSIEDTKSIISHLKLNKLFNDLQ